jgi:hypothetical protein
LNPPAGGQVPSKAGQVSTRAGQVHFILYPFYPPVGGQVLELFLSFILSRLF